MSRAFNFCFQNKQQNKNKFLQAIVQGAFWSIGIYEPWAKQKSSRVSLNRRGPLQVSITYVELYDLLLHFFKFLSLFLFIHARNKLVAIVGT